MKNTIGLLAFIYMIFFFSSCQKEYSYEGGPFARFIYDADAEKFINASGIEDNTQKIAINDFVISLKDSLLWSKFIAIYPMIGGTKASCQWNLKDPRDMDIAYRLTFYGNPVYANTGILFTTIADYADTHVVDNAIDYNNATISYYSETQNTVDGYDMGCSDILDPYNELAVYESSDASNWFGYYAFGTVPVNTKGLFMLSATTNDVKRYENGVATDARALPPVNKYTNMPILIGKVADAAVGGLKECALATIGYGLNDKEAMVFYTLVAKYQYKLNR